MKKRLLLFNAASSVLQILVSSVSLILLYRMLITIIGIEQLGVWSLVLATTSMAQLASMGITGSIVKFVAKYSANDQLSKLSLLIETATISIAAIFVIILLIAFPCASQYLKYALHGDLCDAALAILPHALIAYWIAMLTSVFQAGLYGCQLIGSRNNLLMAESVSYLVICYFIAGRYGLIGLAYARVFQNLISMAVSWIILKRHVRELPVIPYRWDRTVFKEILAYSVNFQVISVLAMLCDPLTKGLLSRFGSASMVGYYEMANRLVQQFRSIIVSANQVMVPAFAQLKELEPDKIRTVYLKSYRVLFFFSLPVFSALIIGSPIISEIWIGRNESVFVWSMIILSAGWFVNTLCVPAYYAGLGTGELRWNTISHAAMAVLNLSMGFFLGRLYGGLGVVAGWAISLAMGGIMLGISFHKLNHLPLMEFFPWSSRWLTVSCLGAIVFSFLLYRNVALSAGPLPVAATVIVSFTCILACPIWVHPVRKELYGLICGLRKRNLAAQQS